MNDKTALKKILANTQLFLSNKIEESSYNDLVKALHYHEWAYYVNNSPVISDFDFDQLYQKLVALETSNPSIIQSDSPSQRVSSDLNPDFPTVPHLNPMLSLANSYNEEDLNEFDKQIRKLSIIEDSKPI